VKAGPPDEAAAQLFAQVSAVTGRKRSQLPKLMARCPKPDGPQKLSLNRSWNVQVEQKAR
jgi:hypothetical protein